MQARSFLKLQTMHGVCELTSIIIALHTPLRAHAC